MLSDGARNSQQAAPPASVAPPASAALPPSTLGDGARNTMQDAPVHVSEGAGAGSNTPLGVSENASARVASDGKQRASRKSGRGTPSSRRVSNEGVTRGSLMLTAEGKLLEKMSTEQKAAPENQTLTGLFLSGQQSNRMATTELESEGTEEGEDGLDREMDLDYFPDPPCIMPYHKDPNEDEVETAGLPSYWKDHAVWLQFWPQLEETRERNATFGRQLSSIGRTATGSNLANANRAFVNISEYDVALRTEPTMDNSAKTASLVHPGQMCFIEKVTKVDGVNFLKTKEGWLLETKDGEVIMAECKSIVVGNWWYRVCCHEFVEVRRGPTYSPSAGSGWVLCPHEVIVVNLRCKIDGFEYIQLADGRGWLFCMKPGIMKGNKEHINRVVAECDSDFTEGGTSMDFRGLVPSTSEAVEVGTWTYIVGEKAVLALGSRKCGTYINAGDIVKVDKRAIGNGDELLSLVHAEEGEKKSVHIDAGNSKIALQDRLWVHLQDERGWMPTMGDDGKVLMILQDTKNVVYPSYYQGSKNLDKPEEDWMIGFC